MPSFTYSVTEQDVADRLGLSTEEASNHDFTDDIEDAISVVRKYLEPYADEDDGDALNKVVANIAAHFAMNTVTGRSRGELVESFSVGDASKTYDTSIVTSSSSDHWARAVLLDPTGRLDSGADLGITVI